MSGDKYRVFESHVQEDIEEFPIKMQNPFKIMIRWLKFEILDIEAIMEAISKKNAMEQQQQERIHKREEE